MVPGPMRSRVHHDCTVGPVRGSNHVLSMPSVDEKGETVNNAVGPRAEAKQTESLV